MAGIRYKGQIFSGAAAFGDADHVAYDNTESGLSATDVQGALDEVTSNISSVVDTLINNVSQADYKEISRDVVRAKEQTSGYGNVYLGPGLYIAFSQTTVAANYNGRAYCDYGGNGATVVDFVPPTMTEAYSNNQIVQLIIVKSGTTSLQRRYWDTQATGAKHIWQIHRIF